MTTPSEDYVCEAYADAESKECLSEVIVVTEAMALAVARGQAKREGWTVEVSARECRTGYLRHIATVSPDTATPSAREAK